MRKEGTTKIYVLPLSKRARRVMKEQGIRLYTGADDEADGGGPFFSPDVRDLPI
jgi:hypothetical protein